MNKKTVGFIIIVAMLLTVSLYFIGGTYARYTDTLTGNATAQIAKWAVKVNESDVATTKTLTLNFTTDDNEFVKDGRIAPASSISSELKLDLTGTEVAVDVLGKVDTADLSAKIGTSVFTAKITVDGKELKEAAEAEPTIAVGETGSQHTVKVTITWDNDSDKQSTSDTNLGRGEDLELQLPVTLTVQQHIAAE